MISFLSVLDRAIKDTYGLGESDISVRVIKPIVNQFVFYDVSGNKNVPLDKIFDHFSDTGDALYQAYGQLTNCPKQHCRYGCYHCLRSYNTQTLAHAFKCHATRQAALMVVGYLLEKNAFRPSLSSPPGWNGKSSSSKTNNLYLQVNLKSRQAVVKNHNGMIRWDINEGQNIAIYEALAQQSSELFEKNMQKLYILAYPSVMYIAELLHNHHIGNKATREEKAAYEQMLFTFLRYVSVRAVDYAKLPLLTKK